MNIEELNKRIENGTCLFCGEREAGNSHVIASSSIKSWNNESDRKVYNYWGVERFEKPNNQPKEKLFCTNDGCDKLLFESIENVYLAYERMSNLEYLGNRDFIIKEGYIPPHLAHIPNGLKEYNFLITYRVLAYYIKRIHLELKNKEKGLKIHIEDCNSVRDRIDLLNRLKETFIYMTRKLKEIKLRELNAKLVFPLYKHNPTPLKNEENFSFFESMLEYIPITKNLGFTKGFNIHTNSHYPNPNVYNELPTRLDTLNFLQKIKNENSQELPLFTKIIPQRNANDKITDFTLFVGTVHNKKNVYNHELHLNSLRITKEVYETLLEGNQTKRDEIEKSLSEIDKIEKNKNSKIIIEKLNDMGKISFFDYDYFFLGFSSTQNIFDDMLFSSVVNDNDMYYLASKISKTADFYSTNSELIKKEIDKNNSIGLDFILNYNFEKETELDRMKEWFSHSDLNYETSMIEGYETLIKPNYLYLARYNPLNQFSSI